MQYNSNLNDPTVIDQILKRDNKTGKDLLSHLFIFLYLYTFKFI